MEGIRRSTAACLLHFVSTHRLRWTIPLSQTSGKEEGLSEDVGVTVVGRWRWGEW